jgi:hypothetical protein
MPTIAQAAKAIVEREGRTYIWFGHVDLWHEAYETATGSVGPHPKDVWQSVRNALSRSKLFHVKRRIRAVTWSGKEILHPRFDLVEPSNQESEK